MGLTAKALLVVAMLVLFQRDAWAWGFDIGGEHIAMTWAAVRVLSSAVLAVLGAQAVKLFKVYCGYPDFNWARYGTLTDGKDPWSDSMSGKRIPDKRRDWNASEYCGYDEGTGRGSHIGHGPPSSAEGARDILGIALRQFRAGRIVEGARYAGAALHYAQDSASPPHVLPTAETPEGYHGPMESVKHKDRVRIDGYTPRVMGRTDADILGAFDLRHKEVMADSLDAARRMVLLLQAGREEEADAIVTEVACSLARFTADVLTTLASVAPSDAQPEHTDHPTGANLLKNGDFQESSAGDGQPDAWVRDWHDLDDTEADTQYLTDAGREGSCCVSLAKTPAAGAEWRTRWADALFVSAGQRFRCSGWVKAPSATGRTCLRAYLTDCEMDHLKIYEGERIVNCPDWRQLSFEFTIPSDVIEVRVACFSADNQGECLFDDVELVRL